MSRHLPLAPLAHQRLAAVIETGDYAVDATVGNGHDTLFLASQVGETGHVWGFDIQAAALANAQARLIEQGLSDRVSLIEAGHETLTAQLPNHALGKLAAVMFNLGYLPGSNKAITTRADTTLSALAAAAANLRPGGVVSVLVYRGHPGGQAEADAVAAWSQAQSSEKFSVEQLQSPGPVLYLLTRHPQ